MSWREVLAETPYTQNTHNTHNPLELASSADIADIAYERSQKLEPLTDLDRVRSVIEVTLLPGVDYSEILGWMSNVDIQLIEQGVYGATEVRKFLVYEKSVRDGGLRKTIEINHVEE